MKYLLMAGLVFCFGLIDGLYARIDEQIVKEAAENAEKERAAKYAAVLTACLNGKSIQQEEIKVECYRRRK